MATPNWLLLDDEAREVSILTGIPWFLSRVHQRGPLHPTLDLRELDWWDRWRVMLARVTGRNLMDKIGNP